ncbi:MAG: GNAT family N-acetyltransferase [Alphaproteobacteria bacterium]
MDQAPLRTARLVGEPPADSDLPDLRAMFQHPDFAATMSADGAPWPEQRIGLFLERAWAHWTLYGFGSYVFRDQAGALVGYCGLRLTLLEGEPVVELLYGVAPAFHRQGHATEMAGALIADGETRLGVREIAAWTLPRNTGSQKVMQACGFTYERDITYADLPHVLYRRRG